MLRMLVFACVLSLVCASFTDDEYYTAAVVEYTPITNYNPNITVEHAQAVMLANVKQYEVLVAQAKKRGAQIIVFPEDGLYGAGFATREGIYPFLEEIPDTSPAVICNNRTYRDSSPVLYALSCVALSYDIVLVVNMGDVVPCTVGVGGCPSDGRFQYNTDVVFAETGNILTKYHKSNLYFETQFNQPPIPDPKNFTTSFGVTFGIMICYDIMFPYPQLDYSQANITNLIYSTWWVNTPPTLSANQVQLSWSSVSNANLLAAGIGLNLYSSGSGIYSSGTPMEVFYNPTWTPSQTLLVSILPKNPPLSSSPLLKRDPIGDSPRPSMKRGSREEEEVDALLSLRNKMGMIGKGRVGDGTGMATFVASAGTSGNVTVTMGNLTCSASYLIANETTEEVYVLTVLNGDYFPLYNAQMCVLMQCANGSCNSTSIEANTVFQEFYLEGNFSSSSRIYSSVTTDSMYLAPVALYTTDGAYINSTAFNIPLLSASILSLFWDVQ